PERACSGRDARSSGWWGAGGPTQQDGDKAPPRSSRACGCPPEGRRLLPDARSRETLRRFRTHRLRNPMHESDGSALVWSMRHRPLRVWWVSSGVHAGEGAIRPQSRWSSRPAQYVRSDAQWHLYQGTIRFVPDDSTGADASPQAGAQADRINYEPVSVFSSRFNAARAKDSMLAARSDVPVRMTSARSTSPAIATHEVPAGSPYRLPVGPAAPISAIAHDEPRRLRTARASSSAVASVRPRIAAKSASPRPRNPASDFLV